MSRRSPQPQAAPKPRISPEREEELEPELLEIIDALARAAARRDHAASMRGEEK